MNFHFINYKFDFHFVRPSDDNIIFYKIMVSNVFMVCFIYLTFECLKIMFPNVDLQILVSFSVELARLSSICEISYDAKSS